jgi:hypothetical protein
MSMLVLSINKESNGIAKFEINFGLVCGICNEPLELAKTAGISHTILIAPCQTCLDNAKKLAGEAGQIQGYDQAIADLTEAETPAFEAEYQEMIKKEDISK